MAVRKKPMKLQERFKHRNCLSAFLCILLLGACSNEAPETPGFINDDGEHTAVLRFEGSLETFDGDTITTGKATRATTTSWANGATLYLHSPSGSSTTNYGYATYNSSSKTWTVTYSGSLVKDKATLCNVYYFENPTQTNSSSVSLSAQSTVYADVQATYYFSNNIVTLKAKLKPQTARFRIKGTSGSATIQGLKVFSSYTRNSGTLASTTADQTLTIASSGYSPYIYANLVNDQTRQLTFKISSTAGYRRAFSTDAFKVGSTGVLTVPTAEKHAGWTLVNLSNGKQITAPSVGLPSVTDIQADNATVNATVTSVNNGTISDAGFIVIVPLIGERKISCGTKTSLSAVLSNLTPETTYKVRAYATNEAGTAYSNYVEFKTSKNPGLTFGELSAINIRSTNVTLTCSVKASGDITVSQAGFVLATHTGPTVSDRKVSCGENMSLSASVPQLSPSTTYYVRAYAVSSIGTVYSSEISFKTDREHIDTGIGVIDYPDDDQW